MDKLLRLVRQLPELEDFRRVRDELVDLAVEFSGAERGMLIAKEPGTGVLHLSSARNMDRESLKGREARLSMSIAEQALASGEAVLLEDALRQNGFSMLDSVAQLGVRSVCASPISLQDRAVAVLYVDSRFIPGAFGPQEATKVDLVASVLALTFWMEGSSRARGSQEAELQRALEREKELRCELEEHRATGRSALAIEERRDVPRGRFPAIIGQASSMQRMFDLMEKVLDKEVTVLILGESGTGKELVARAIHRQSKRSDKPFVAINCASIPASLIESELFGYTRGAFTGANRDKPGLFDMADEGILFLDEVGDMPLEMQGKLLRTLQYGEVHPLGAPGSHVVNVRVIAATHHNLERRVAEGAFREDLFYRLNVIGITVPALRDRREDIPLLVQHFLEENRRQGISAVTRITPRALLLLSRHSWPGNVRELDTVLKSSCLFADRDTLDAADFRSLVGESGPAAGSVGGLAVEGRTLEDIERDVIHAALKANDGNKKKTAEVLGIDRRTLYNKLARYGM